MTFVVKTRGDSRRPILAEYTCPKHGLFEAIVQRNEHGEAPDEIECSQVVGGTIPVAVDYAARATVDLCGLASAWTPSPVIGRVRRVEVVRGKYEKPERKTWLDTRNLGEGQDIDDFREDRRKIRDEQREREIMEMLKS